MDESSQASLHGKPYHGMQSRGQITFIAGVSQAADGTIVVSYCSNRCVCDQTEITGKETAELSRINRRVQERETPIGSSTMEKDQGTWAAVVAGSREENLLFATEVSPTWERRRDEIPSLQDRRLG